MSNLISQLQTQQGAFNFVEDIINDIINGDRYHVQSDYHTITDCGTAHCIAGWIENDIMSDIGQELHITEYTCANKPYSYTYYDTELQYDREIRIESIIKQYFNEELYNTYKYLPTIPVWSLATAILGITNEESSLLFEAYLSIDEIESNFYRLKEIYSIK